MPVILTRIDDRLIHGQVTEGWGKIFKPDLVVVVSDGVASSEWEKELCLAALPAHMEGTVVSVDDAPQIINQLVSDQRPSYILFESPRDVYMALKKGSQISALNVGGMHSVKEKHEILDYIFVNEEDIKYLKSFRDAGITLDFRDLPDHDNIDVMSLL